ncbi:MAG: type VI secretion system baseplate subunit TssE [Holosporales bacterium]|nr:type VI secretion system baseplate subunit TssE [Holosporales bacterium]
MKKQFVAIAPFFDQLTANAEQATKILFTFNELLESIQKELTEIFETRSSFSIHEVDEFLQKADEDETKLAGIPGLLGFPVTENIFIEDTASWGKLEEKCELIIRLFEPRLQGVKVKIEEFAPKNQTLILKIEGSVVTEKVREQVSFTVQANIK